MTEETNTTDCYQCKNDVSINGGQIRKSISGPLFPFCSIECKEKYGIEHFGINRDQEHKFRSIDACQKRIMEWKEEKFGKKIEPYKNVDISDVAKQIFG